MLVMKIKKELVKREIAGDTILVPVGKTMYDSRGMFILNELGAFIWDHLEEAETEADLVRAVTEEYDVEEVVAAADVHEFAEKLRELGVI